MDNDDRQLLKDFLTAETEVEANYSVEAHRQAFRRLRPTTILTFFMDTSTSDDNTIIHFDDQPGNIDRWFHIYTNDDPYFTPLFRQPEIGLYASDLEEE